MSAEKQKNSADQQLQSTIGLGNFTKGKWFCECHIAARCLTATKNTLHQGKKFWRCANIDGRKCTFFLWVAHEAAAKEWLKISQPESNLQTPQKMTRSANPNFKLTAETPSKRNGNDPDSPAMETPFTKAKRRRKVPTDETADNENNRIIGQSTSGSLDPFQTTVAQRTQPSIAAMGSILTTPAQLFAEQMKIATKLSSDFTPVHAATENATQRLAQTLGMSPKFASPKGMASLNPEGESSLALTVLDLIRSDNVELKPSTEIQIRHEINLMVDIGKTKVERYEETISKLHKRVDELEGIVFHLTE